MHPPGNAADSLCKMCGDQVPNSALVTNLSWLLGRLQIEGLFGVWNKALATLDAKKVAALYTSDAILVPTVSNQV